MKYHIKQISLIFPQLETLNTQSVNLTGKAEIEILFFNRCAKVGSESLIKLLELLAKENHLNLNKRGLQVRPKRQLPPPEQSHRTNFITSLGPGSIYIEHVSWIDFHVYKRRKPIYINLVRDPVERVISWFYYTRGAYKNAILFQMQPNKPIPPEKWYKKDFNFCVESGDPECQYIPMQIKDFVGNYKRQSLFFCGHYHACLPFDSPVAIQIAKKRVETEYAVVGTWEETNVTIAVFENYIPRFFSGAARLFESNYFKITNQNRNNRKPTIKQEIKDIVRRNFTNEYEFYYFCRQRLFRQYLALKPKEFFGTQQTVTYG